MYIYIYITGPPRINIITSYMLKTQDDLEVTGTIGGYPRPNVTLYRISSTGAKVEVSVEDDARLDITFVSGTFSFTIQKVLTADNGTYQILASNDEGSDTKDFTVMTIGEEGRKWTRVRRGRGTKFMSLLLHSALIVSHFHLIIVYSSYPEVQTCKFNECSNNLSYCYDLRRLVH